MARFKDVVRSGLPTVPGWGLAVAAPEVPAGVEAPVHIRNRLWTTTAGTPPASPH